MKPCWIGLLLISLSLAGLSSLGQEIFSLSGIIIDRDNKEPLAFVNILVNGGTSGTTTDIDGKFTIRSGVPVQQLKLTYVGYETRFISLETAPEKDFVISLQKKEVQLDEVIIYPTENPAHRIIELVIDNRYRNDPEQLQAFSYTAYERTVITGQSDTLFKMDTTSMDTNLREVRDFLDRQDLALMETVTERTFLHPDKDYNNVTANRVSGMKDPVFVFIVSQMQSTSFYDELFHMVDKHYVNPISKGSTSKYFFLIEDTTYTERGDSVFIISFRPRINTNFDGLEGVLYINSYKWAIQNVIAKPARPQGLDIKIQQMYELIDSVQWFPVQLNTDVVFQNVQVSADSLRMKIVGSSKSYIKDIVIDQARIRKRLDMLGIDVEPDANEKSEAFWSGYRIDSLSERDRRTYQFMDSIGEEADLDRLSKGFEAALNGRIRWKYLDIDLDKILKFDSYQGFYLGLGLHSNEWLSKRFKIGGYWGYGFRDKKDKYGGDISYIFHRRRELQASVEYYNDLTESGGVNFPFIEEKVLTGENWYQFLLTREDMTESLTLGLTGRIYRDVKVGGYFNSTYKTGAYDYRYGNDSEGVAISTNTFGFTELRIGVKYAFREEFIVTKRSRISLGSKYPMVWFNYTRGLEGVLGGQYSFNRFDLMVKAGHYFKYLGKSSLVIKAGYIDQDLPYTNLYAGAGSWERFTVYAPGRFANMRMNEFLSDRYLSLFFAHNFGNLLFRSEKFKPEFVIVSNIGFGFLRNPDVHYNVQFKTMNLGYYESGLLINDLLNLRLYTLGLGFFYRYGPYSLDQPIDNCGFKFSIMFPFNE